MSGGGGQSGNVDWPDYMEEIHAQWLTGGTPTSQSPALTPPIELAMTLALGTAGNPYRTAGGVTVETPYDPNTVSSFVAGSPIAQVDVEHTRADSFIGSGAPSTDIATYRNAVDDDYSEVDPSIAPVIGGTSAWKDAFDDVRAEIAALTPSTEYGGFFTTASGNFPAIDPVTTFDTYIANAIAEVVSGLVGETEIDAAIDALEADQLNRHLDAVARFSGGMADINAVNSSQFIIGLAKLESDFADNIDKADADLRLQIKRDKQNLVLQAVGQMIQMLSLDLERDKVINQAVNQIIQIMGFNEARFDKVNQGINEIVRLWGLKQNRLTQIQQAVNQVIQMFNLRAQGRMDLVGKQMDISRIQMIALKEHQQETIELEVQDALWDLSVYQYGANLLAAISGTGQPRVEGLSKAQSALSGAFSGAAAGAAIGSAVPGVGTAVGAGAGGLVGLVGGLLGGA